jgi:hypothetical protein
VRHAEAVFGYLGFGKMGSASNQNTAPRSEALGDRREGLMMLGRSEVFNDAA